MSTRFSGKTHKQTPTTDSRDLKLRKTVRLGMGQRGPGHQYPKGELYRRAGGGSESLGW